ncbi:1-deoxy-D-xylulose-5-phosphate reductoisomerase, partial [Thermus scotoductus]
MILGSTGSIGRQALEVCRWRGYRVVGLAAGPNLEELSRQIQQWRPLLVPAHESLHEELKARFPGLRLGPPEEVASLDAEVAVAAIPGLAGLAPTSAAARTGTRLALANTEATVAAGTPPRQAEDTPGTATPPFATEPRALF